MTHATPVTGPRVQINRTIVLLPELRLRRSELVFLVDDDDDVSEAMSLVLTSHGYTFARARDGAEACRRIADGLRPAVILLDLVMPVMSGLEFLRCHQASAQAHIPIIVFSACLSNSFAANVSDADHTKVPSLPKCAPVPDLLRALARATA